MDPGSLYAIAHQFYWDFRRLAEGGSRWKVDKPKYQQSTEAIDNIDLIDDEDRERYQRLVDEEIRSGILERANRDKRLWDIEDSELCARREDYRIRAAEEATRQIRIPGELEVIEGLLRAKSADDIRKICSDAVVIREFQISPGVFQKVEVNNWPIASGSMLPRQLSQYAEQFVDALRDPRFPRCDVATRPSNRLKQFWFLSRALAGALFGVKTRTAINLVGSLRPEEMFHEARDGKPARRRRKLRHK